MEGKSKESNLPYDPAEVQTIDGAELVKRIRERPIKKFVPSLYYKGFPVFHDAPIGYRLVSVRRSDVSSRPPTPEQEEEEEEEEFPKAGSSEDTSSTVVHNCNMNDDSRVIPSSTAPDDVAPSSALPTPSPPAPAAAITSSDSGSHYAVITAAVPAGRPPQLQRSLDPDHHHVYE